MIKRLAFERLREHLLKPTQRRNVLILEGARQVGKTSLVRQLLPEFTGSVEVNLEIDLVLREKVDRTKSFAEFEKLLKLEKGFDPRSGTVLFIDEAQESTRLGRYVREMKEEWPGTRCLLSGSSMKRLFAEEVRVPVGRVEQFTLSPLIFREFLQARNKQVLLDYVEHFSLSTPIPAVFHEELLKELDHYLHVGGLPEVVLAFDRGENFAHLRRSILLLQQEDFVRKELFRNRDLFMDALRGTASHLGSSAKFSHIATRSAEAKQIIAVMKAWHLLLEVEQRGTSPHTEFFPKRYVYDVGMAQEVRLMPFPQLSIVEMLDPVLRTSLGGLFENMVAIELLGESLGLRHMSAWKKSSQDKVEVDFVIDESTRTIPIEVKCSFKITPRTFQNVRSYLAIAGQRLGIVVSPAPFQILREREFKLVNLPPYLLSQRVLQLLAAEA